MNPILRLVVPTFAALVLCAGTAGCAKWSERRVAKYEVGGPEKVRAAPEPGVYEVKWAAAVDGPRKPVPASSRVLPPFAAIGFAPDADGAVVAVAGGERFPLDRLPPEARYVVWSTKVPRQDRRFPAMTARALLRAARVTLMASAVVAEKVLLGDDDDDDDWGDDGGSSGGGHSHHHGHHGRGKGDEDGGGTGRGYVPWASPAKVK
ncbi:MAG TPA: hypothetical protein VF796_15850 [Humisphaera sp.]